MNQFKYLAAGVLLALGLVVLAETVEISGSKGVPKYSAGGFGQVTLGELLAGENQTEDWIEVAEGPYEFEEIGASATDQSLGTAGSTGDYLAFCMMTVVTAATATFGIEDGTNTAFDNITVVVGGATLVAGQPIYVPVFAQATTAAGWEITTGAGATAYCMGRFDTAGD